MQMDTESTGQASKKAKRALRRLQRRRMIRHARSVFTGHPQLQAWAERRHDYLCSCSCYLCGNRRKHFGLTVQERRFHQMDPYEELGRDNVEREDAPDGKAAGELDVGCTNSDPQSKENTDERREHVPGNRQD